MGKENRRRIEKHAIKTAILVDGGFYRKRAKAIWGSKTPSERANELNDYCYKHLRDNYENRYLYRVFYYDCPPVKKIYTTQSLKKLFLWIGLLNIYG